MSKHDVNYFQFRAESELELAQRATHPSAVRAHYQLAEMYLDKIYGPPSEHGEDGPANDTGAGDEGRRGHENSSSRNCA